MATTGSRMCIMRLLGARWWGERGKLSDTPKLKSTITYSLGSRLFITREPEIQAVKHLCLKASFRRTKLQWSHQVQLIALSPLKAEILKIVNLLAPDLLSISVSDSLSLFFHPQWN